MLLTFILRIHMIVEDPKKMLKKVDEITLKIIELLKSETINIELNDDPAEHIYLAAHVIGNLTARICMLLEGYSKVYGIEAMDHKKIIDWFEYITQDYITLNNPEDTNR